MKSLWLQLQPLYTQILIFGSDSVSFFGTEITVKNSVSKETKRNFSKHIFLVEKDVKEWIRETIISKPTFR